MPAQEIPRHAWVAFFESFSREHDGWLSTIEELGAARCAQAEPSAKALLRISAELNDQDEDIISIIARERPHNDITHIIKAPTRVSLIATEEGAHVGLRIESKNGSVTIVRFRSPILSELVDGVVLD